ncbi:hypothetical protein I204_06413 [Kwoniella mangroviensis CBS 8886]|nr:hypothetical protein I204_06413 [Kwoniella mangroviensis CBS 8886]
MINKDLKISFCIEGLVLLPKDEAKFLTKLDITLITSAALGVMIRYLDQVNLTNAFNSGMKEDLELYGNELNFANALWSAAYVFGQIPSNLLLTRVNAARYIAFLLGGPDWISLIGGEAQNPRKILPRAFNSTVVRIVAFFLVGGLCVGINAPSNDPELLGAIAAGAPGAAKSPYIISMNRLGIPVLPDIVNALVMLSIFSTGNSAVFCSSRGLYTLALKGGAPSVFKRLNRNGVPYVAVTAILLFSALAYLSVNSGSVVVLNWFLSLVGAANLVNWTSIALTYMRFRRGLIAQGKLNNDFLPVRAWLQPLSRGWAGDSFVFTYGAVFIFAGFIIFFKTYDVLVKKKPLKMFIPAEEIDVTTGLEVIEALTAASNIQDEQDKKTMGRKVSDFFF